LVVKAQIAAHNDCADLPPTTVLADLAPAQVIKSAPSD
jgi:hypothetical protein